MQGNSNEKVFKAVSHFALLSTLIDENGSSLLSLRARTGTQPGLKFWALAPSEQARQSRSFGDPQTRSGAENAKAVGWE